MVEVAEKQLTSKQRSKIERQMLSLRASLWPKVAEDSMWHYKASQGWLSMPRALPHILLAMDNLSKGKPLSSAYLDLWCRTYDNSFVIANKPREMAFCAGFTGERAEHTWTSRIQILAKLGFIDYQAGPSGPISYVLIYNPYHVIKRHGDNGELDQATYNAIKQRMVEIGALDMEDPAKQVSMRQSASPIKHTARKRN